MNCADARHRILIADLAALRGETDRALAAHLASCASCAADARRVVERTALLAQAIAESRSVERRPRRSVSLQRMAWVPIIAAAGFLAMTINHSGAAAHSFYADTLGVHGLITPIAEDSEPFVAISRASDSSIEHRSSDSAQAQRGPARAGILRYNRSLIRQVADLTSAPFYTLAVSRSSR